MSLIARVLQGSLVAILFSPQSQQQRIWFLTLASTSCKGLVRILRAPEPRLLEPETPLLSPKVRGPERGVFVADMRACALHVPCCCLSRRLESWATNRECEIHMHTRKIGVMEDP